MAATVSVLKLTQTHGVVKVRGTGQGTIGLASTLKKDTESTTSPVVNIKSISWSMEDTAASAKITRGGTDIFYMCNWGHLDFLGFADNEENDEDIVIEFSNGKGTIILEMLKVSGYGPQQHQDQGALG